MNRWIPWISVVVALAAVSRSVAVELLGGQPQRSIGSDVFQGVVAGGAIGFLTAQIYARVTRTTVDGWTTMFGCGVPGNGMLFRAACMMAFPGPVNVPDEGMYWTARRDGAGRGLSGRRRYVLRFPAGGLPPNAAFWSLTMGDANNRFVPNPIHRYSVGDRSGLVPNADGSVDIHIQRDAPPGRESNWLPAPAGRFIVWLRVYLPGAAILDGTYQLPPIVEAT